MIYKSIGELCDIKKGETGIMKSVAGEYPLVTTGPTRKSCNTYQFDTEAVCIPLVSSTGHGHKSLNYVHYQSGKFALGTILAAVIPRNKAELSAEYLQRYLFFFKDQKIVTLMSGAANVTLSIKNIAKIEVPVPPLDEQKDFIKLFGNIETHSLHLQAEFYNQSSYLTQLRQAILQEAIEGKLTVDWRKENPVIKGDPDFDAEALLEKIKIEKEKLIAEGKIKKQKVLAPIKQEKVPFELPEGWVWTRLGEITDLITKGSSPSWQGIQYVENDIGIRFITSKNVGSYSLDFSKETFVEKRFNEIQPRSTLLKGDILTNIVGASIGRTALYDIDDLANINQAVCILRYTHNHILKLFFLHWMNSKWLIDKMHQDEFSPGRANLSMGNISNFPIPLPSFAEQNAIVERVSRLLAMVDHLEKQVSERKEQADMLMQAVLKEAFDGGHNVGK